MEYKTPGVYVEEISTLPPSVAGVATAIPAFLGYTEKGPKHEPVRISSLLEYESIFGGPQPSTITVTTETVDGVTAVSSISTAAIPDFLLYYSMQMFFKNGGSACYIVSVGSYSDAAQAAHFTDGLAEVEKVDEPTLILLTDAVKLAGSAYHGLCVEVLAQCAKLGDRFGIFDVQETDTDATNFRSAVASDNLKYGAAYTPFLLTNIPVAHTETSVTVDVPSVQGSATIDGLLVKYAGNSADSPRVVVRAGSAGDPLAVSVQGATDSSSITLMIEGVGTGAAVTEILALWEAVPNKGGLSLEANGSPAADVATTHSSPGLALTFSTTPTSTLASLAQSQTSVYNQVKLALTTNYITMPPAAAVAGVYATIDRTRGVWKAPANTSLASVLAPMVKYTHEDQENLNVDPTAGKSINAIRSFAGKGTLIWGARTLAGNDNEWRYVNVRRLFNFIQESIQKATSFAVFESNTATTWLKVKGMIDSYLYGLWQQGALAGAKPEQAYFINVGLGRTMTPQDILEGRMIVEIGIAAVRPAEFIILRFSHKLQEA